MDALKALSSLHCEFKIMSAKNIQVTDSKRRLFVRCYIPAGNNKRVRLETQEISSNGGFAWNESFSLDCIGTEQSVDMIIHGTIVLELRWRSNTVPLFGKIMGGCGNIGGSLLLGRAEVSWRGTFESPNMELERWVMMKSKKSVVKASCIRIAMKIHVPVVAVITERKKNDIGKLKSQWDKSCGCCHDHCCNNSCIDSEIFAIGAALDAF